MDPGPSYKQLEVKTKTNINKVNKTWTLEPSYKQLEVKTKTNINKVNKTWTLLQTTGGKD